MPGTTDVILMTISRTTPTSEPERTSREQMPSKTAPFSVANAYNSPTTIQPLISKFEKISTP